jgi:hypothetical protein
MSIRRKSCDVCYMAQRKCDLAYPVCERCERNSKRCHYVYPPHLPKTDSESNVDDTTAIRLVTGEVSYDRVSYPVQLMQSGDGNHRPFQTDSRSNLPQNKLQHIRIPKQIGHLGELLPVSATRSWVWLSNQFRDCPLAFAEKAVTMFIHKTLYRNSVPRQLRVAFGICAGCVFINERNQSVLFQALDAEISELLIPALTRTLLEDLVTLQAAVLYQIIRIFYGGLEQRIVAERQEFLVRSIGLTLLQRANTEPKNAQQTWETWHLAESIRRTVLIAFKLYTLYSHFRDGKCKEVAALNLLPVSTNSSLWNYQDSNLLHPDQDETMTYNELTSRWAAAPRKELELFEKLLLIDWRGIVEFEALIGYRGVVE